MIKLIKFDILDHSLFEGQQGFSIATVSALDKNTISRTIELSTNLSINRVLGVSGLNAVGKTTLLELFAALHEFYISGKGIAESGLKRVLRGETEIAVNAYLYENVTETVYKAYTIFRRTNGEDGETWSVKEEKIYKKHLTKSATKKSVFEFDESHLEMDRGTTPILFLNRDESMLRGVKFDAVSPLIYAQEMTNANVGLTFSDQTPIELIQYLDDSIEFFEHVNDPEDNSRLVGYRFKFKNESRTITAHDMDEVALHLSSGTVRGITLFYVFLRALRTGATLIVDEIELHVNKKIIRDFVNFFADDSINTNNATLIFTTHYVELLDDLKRKDEMYLVVRRGLSKVVRVSDLKNSRVELKRSEQFLTSNYKTDDDVKLVTAPSARRLTALRKAIKQHNDAIRVTKNSEAG